MKLRKGIKNIATITDGVLRLTQSETDIRKTGVGLPTSLLLAPGVKYIELQYRNNLYRIEASKFYTYAAADSVKGADHLILPWGSFEVVTNVHKNQVSLFDSATETRSQDLPSANANAHAKRVPGSKQNPPNESIWNQT
jgi:hypothetical protein